MLVKMKKVLYGSMVAFVALFALASTPAQAFCVQLTNFCDRLEVNLDISGNAYGLWDWQCDGITMEEVLGTKMGPTAVVAGHLAGIAATASWVFDDIPGSTADLWVYQDGGLSAPTLGAPNQPYTVIGASCGFGVPNASSHLPPILSN